jgi:hypothetical protein
MKKQIEEACSRNKLPPRWENLLLKQRAELDAAVNAPLWQRLKTEYRWLAVWERLTALGLERDDISDNMRAFLLRRRWQIRRCRWILLPTLACRRACREAWGYLLIGVMVLAFPWLWNEFDD